MRYLSLLVIPLVFFALLGSDAWARRTASSKEHAVRWDMGALEERLQGTWMLSYRETLEQYPARAQRAKRLAISEVIFGLQIAEDRSVERTHASMLGGSQTARFSYEVLRVEGESMIFRLLDEERLLVETWKLTFLDEAKIILLPSGESAEIFPEDSVLILERAEEGLLHSAIRSATLWQYGDR